MQSHPLIMRYHIVLNHAFKFIFIFTSLHDILVVYGCLVLHECFNSNIVYSAVLFRVPVFFFFVFVPNAYIFLALASGQFTR